VGAPCVERELALTHTAYAAYVFAAPLVAAAILEGAVALFSDALDRTRLVILGQAALAASLLALACARSAPALSIGLTLAGVSSGVACGAAQALSITGHGRGADRAMVRWALFASMGDLAAPLVTALALALGCTYRAAMAAVSAAVAVQCAWGAMHLRARSRQNSPQTPSSSKPPEAADLPGPPDLPDPSVAVALAPQEPWLSVVSRAARRPRLWVWLFAAASCTLLDELVVALAALRLARDLGVGAALAAGAAVTFSGGALVGTALTERAIARLGARAVLLTSSILCGLALCLLIRADHPLLSCLALFCVGATSAPHHPLAQALAYQQMPNRPGAVQALGQLFVVVDILAPLALGQLADTFGLRAALGCLLLQPIVIAAFTAKLVQRQPCPSCRR
jgi:MFS family permease